MTSWDDRAKSAEQQYKRDQELAFKVTARRNRLLGLWVAEKLGLSGPEADAYAKSVVESDFQKPGDDDVVEKVVGDLKKAGSPLGDAEIRYELHQMALEAKKQLTSGS